MCRDSRDSLSEKTPFAMAPFSGPEFWLPPFGAWKMTIAVLKARDLTFREKLYTPPPPPPPDFGQKEFLKETWGVFAYFPAAGFLYPSPLLYAPPTP